MPCLYFQEIEAFVKKFRQPMIADFNGVTSFAVGSKLHPRPIAQPISRAGTAQPLTQLEHDNQYHL